MIVFADSIYLVLLSSKIYLVLCLLCFSEFWKNVDARVWTLDDVVGVAVAGREIRELIKGKGLNSASCKNRANVK